MHLQILFHKQISTKLHYSDWYIYSDYFFQNKIQIVTVASSQTHGYQRFIESCNVYGFPVVTLGMGVQWKWDLTMGPGGGIKVNLLKEYLSKFGDEDEIV